MRPYTHRDTRCKDGKETDGSFSGDGTTKRPWSRRLSEPSTEGKLGHKPFIMSVHELLRLRSTAGPQGKQQCHYAQKWGIMSTPRSCVSATDDSSSACSRLCRCSSASECQPNGRERKKKKRRFLFSLAFCLLKVFEAGRGVEVP